MSVPKTVSLDELDSIDRQTVDSVMADRLINTVRSLHESARAGWDWSNDLLGKLLWLHLADLQGDLDEASGWLATFVSTGAPDELYEHPWAHDWRLYAAVMANERSERFRKAHYPENDPRPTSCQICDRPARIHGLNLAACSNRHMHAVKGELPDEQCRLCNRVTVCAFELDRSPVCADCWPADFEDRRRAVWREARGIGQ